MIRAGLLAVALCTGPALAAPEIRNASGPVPGPAPGVIEACLTAAAVAYRIPAPLLVIILRVENGRLGRVTPNASGAPPDVGPMQVNAQWLPRIAARWGVSQDVAFPALRDDFCANVEAGAWIMRAALDEARGDFWRGVAIYHSPKGEHQRRYLRLVLEQSLRMFNIVPPGSERPVADRTGHEP